MRIARSNYNPPIYSTIGADLVQEARVVERQKVLNELRTLIEAVPVWQTKKFARYSGDTEPREVRDYKEDVLSTIRRYETEEN